MNKYIICGLIILIFIIFYVKKYNLKEHFNTNSTQKIAFCFLTVGDVKQYEVHKRGNNDHTI